MNDITPAQQQQVEALAGSLAAKLRTFHESLTPDEQQVLGAARWQFGTHPDEATADTAGYSTVTMLELAATRVMALLQMGTAPYQPPPLPSQPS
jgi:hypothetical protein